MIFLLTVQEYSYQQTMGYSCLQIIKNKDIDPMILIKNYIKLVLLISIMFSSCGFNKNDDKAWVSKLTEGIWQQYIVNQLGNPISFKWTFNKDATFDLWILEKNHED